MSAITPIRPSTGTTQSAEIPYVDLTEDQTKILHKLITQIGDTGWFMLTWKQTDLEKLGAQLNNVHPLKFLAAIFTHDVLKMHMISIFDDSYKREAFLKGLSGNLETEAKGGKLLEYADDFAKTIKKDPETIKKHLCSLKWEEFVRYLIES